VTRRRGEAIDAPPGARGRDGAAVRAPDETTRRRETERFIADLKKVAALL
jgi:hypothetical protein